MTNENVRSDLYNLQGVYLKKEVLSCISSFSIPLFHFGRHGHRGEPSWIMQMSVISQEWQTKIKITWVPVHLWGRELYKNTDFRPLNYNAERKKASIFYLHFLWLCNIRTNLLFKKTPPIYQLTVCGSEVWAQRDQVLSSGSSKVKIKVYDRLGAKMVV